jgi:DNA-binding transcriptional LysR family regulator
LHLPSGRSQGPGSHISQQIVAGAKIGSTTCQSRQCKQRPLGSLTRAALFLDINQSLLSRQLNALERECGARLFNRTGRGVELSDMGERIFPQVRALLADAERLEAEIRGEAREPAGRVTLGSLPSIGPTWLAACSPASAADFLPCT